MNQIEVNGHPHLGWLQVNTPGRFAMGLAIEVLSYLDEQPAISVKNTGWKNGFGLEVCAWIPINMASLVAELETDGDEFQIRKSSGSVSDFEILFNLVRAFLDDKIA